MSADSGAVPARLVSWLAAALGTTEAELGIELIAGDASFRRYFRVTAGDGRSRVCCHAPPEHEKNDEFLAVRNLFEASDVRVPALEAVDLEQGFLLLEDLGDGILQRELHSTSVEAYYGAAFALLERLASIPLAGASLPPYDRPALQRELDLFPEWFCDRLLATPLSAEARVLFASLSERLIDNAHEQASVVVHRDFHSRNLMVLDDGALACIDFQDAVVGPVTYDLVSLLRDCYVAWPAAQVRRWALRFRDRLAAAGVLGDVSDSDFLRCFDLMGLQRHIKVLGIFSRLHLRDGKPAYLGDLPRVLAYVEEVLAAHRDTEPALEAFSNWLARELRPVIARQRWMQGP